MEFDIAAKGGGHPGATGYGTYPQHLKVPARTPSESIDFDAAEPAGDKMPELVEKHDQAKNKKKWDDVASDRQDLG
jgi:hypothetical protein